MNQSFLRTLFRLAGSNSYANVPLSLNFSNLIYLRVLDLSYTRGLETLPESIGKLKLLRYLDLSETGIALLSDEVFGNLINLQTLKLRGCRNLEMLPGNMRKLTNLRHLDITESGKLLGMPVGMGQLKSLHTLSHFKVSEDSGCGTVGELQELDHLGGSLEISCLWKVKDVRDAENAKLSRKENIRDLRLNWSLDWSRSTVTAAESQANSMNEKLIADALEPHPNIKKLDFIGYGGSEFPRWMNSTCFFSLVKLNIFNCSKGKHLPTLGLLPHLKKLDLSYIPEVECIGNEFYCDEEEEGNNMMKAAARGMMVLFPALVDLVLSEMRSLEEWKGWSSSSSSPLPVSVFPVLQTLRILKWLSSSSSPLPVSVFPVFQTLRILNCPKLSTIPPLHSLTSLKVLSIKQCDGLKSLSLHHLTNLHELTISCCRELELLPDDFQNLVSYRYLA